MVGSSHGRAWRETLQLLVESAWRDIRPRTTYVPERFVPAVYQEGVAGKPRLSGARVALDVARVGDEELLQRAGADLVVTTLDALPEVRLERRSR